MEDKVCIVTGASAGSMGEGIAKGLAEAGFGRLVLVARGREKLEKTAESCKKLGAKEVLILTKDLSNIKTSAEVIEETVAKFGSKQ